MYLGIAYLRSLSRIPRYYLILITQVVLVEGHFLPFVPVCNRNEFVFLASCTPVVLPETRESIVQGATNIFTTIHSMDMKYLHIDKT